LSCQLFGYIIPGFVIFMVIPAVVFWHIEEGWSYLDSLYFAFVALTTIGFGDYVAGVIFSMFCIKNTSIYVPTVIFAFVKLK
jgi:hypothetical protein